MELGEWSSAGVDNLTTTWLTTSKKNMGSRKQMSHMMKVQLAAQICRDNLEMQTVLPKQAKEELLAIYRDSCMMFLLTTRTFG